MNYQTCYNLIKREYYETRNSILWIFVLTLMLLFIQSLTANPGTLLTLESLERVYFGLGSIIACYAFWEFKLNSNMQAYFLIPANPLEKIVAKLIFYILGWFILFMLCFIIANSITIYKLLFLIDPATTQLKTLSTSQSLWQFLLQAVLIQSIAIFASAYFKRKVLIKLACAYIIIILPLKHCYSPIVTLYSANHGEFQYSSSLTALAQIVTIAGLWALTWLRFKETEAR